MFIADRYAACDILSNDLPAACCGQVKYEDDDDTFETDEDDDDDDDGSSSDGSDEEDLGVLYKPWLELDEEEQDAALNLG
eukprot:COSAG06_NODE_4923_length_3856_cov_3.048177_6_plen_80_part_00